MTNNSYDPLPEKRNVIPSTKHFLTTDFRDQLGDNQFYSNLNENQDLDQAIQAFIGGKKGNHYGLCKPSGFRVRFELPNMSTLASNSKTNLIDFYAKSVTVPGKNIESTPNRIYGPEREMPDGVSYAGDIDINFILTNDFFLYRWILQWMNSIVGETTANLNYYNNYVSRMFIMPTVNYGNAYSESPLVYVVEDVWPKTITGYGLDQSLTNTTIEYSASFSFRKWHYIYYNRTN